jgi:hypothetical protein
MIPKQHAEGSIALSNLADHLVPYVPPQSSAPAGLGAQDLQEPRGLQQRNLCPRGRVVNIPLRGILGQSPRRAPRGRARPARLPAAHR